MITMILAVMNRTERINQILELWAEQNNISEIVICDWSSEYEIYEDLAIRQILDKYNKIKVIRIDNQEVFSLVKAYNLAYKFTNSNFKYLLKIDVDYLLKDNSLFNFLFSHNLDKSFIRGCAKFEGGFYPYCGFFFIKKKYYPTFNENLLDVYGKDDLELYHRIQKIYKLKMEVIDVPRYIYHIPHDRNLRYANYKIRGQIGKDQFNKKKFLKWYPQEYEIVEQKPQYTKVKKKDKDENTPDNFSILEYNKKTFYEPPTISENPPKSKY